MLRFGYILAFLAIGALALPQHDHTHSPVNQLSPRALPVGTCNSDTPCKNGACCGSNGLCGYSPTEYGAGCSSNCNSKAQCGQYGTPGHQNGPLNVCCSQFGSVNLTLNHGPFVLITELAGFAEVLLSSVTLAVNRGLVDAVPLLNRSVSSPKSAGAQSGEYRGRWYRTGS